MKIFQSFLGIDTIHLGLTNVYGRHPFEILFKRLSYRSEIKKAQKRTLIACKDKKIVFVSNGEGFIAFNLIEHIRDNTDAKIVILQHGLFEMLTYNFLQRTLKKWINAIFKTFFDVKVIGSGFGAKIADKYIVYCEEYREFLKQNGWLENDVIISSLFLKGKEKEEIKNNKIDCNDNVLLIIQPLSATYQTSRKTEAELYKKLIKTLLKKFQNVFMRQHPYYDVDIPIYSDKQFLLRGNTLEEDIKIAETIISFTSTALIEYEHYNKKFIAVYTNALKKHQTAYFAFKNIYFIDKDLDMSFDVEENKDRGREYFYQTEINSTEELLNLIIET